ncbi:glutamine synthetase family protein [Dickeya oryzae]|uniref:glutamine synthetase family protein n=1 Tax=Dickeya oryzae TaxID=1240404 RepID=UPI0003A43DC4|nr:glutamine synthetase family protein [Dickeya oryzae]
MPLRVMNANVVTGSFPEPVDRCFRDEVETYLKHYPDTEHVDIYLHDLNGCVRGKRLSVRALFTLEQGCYFPLSVYAMDLEGHVIEQSGLGKQVGEPDRLCLPVIGTLRPCADDPAHHAQLLLTMKNVDGTACELEPRVVLQNLLRRFHDVGLYPVVAAELEFYLRDRSQSVPLSAQPSHCFLVDEQGAQLHFLDEIERHARMQQVPLTGIVAEAEAGQYEFNVQHSDKVLEACEQVLTLKRITRQLAEKFNQSVCFMAKPYAELSGSGLHVHISLRDRHGVNLLASEPGQTLSETMRRSLAGMMALMPASVALLAPNVNAFRRLRQGGHAPLHASWGFNDRSVALRLPCAGHDNQRIEYRLAGADANPYLVMATLLSGMWYGLEHDLPLTGTGRHEAIPLSERVALPQYQQDALAQFRQCLPLQELLGNAFSQLWLACKNAELRHFDARVTEAENEWHL